jgi:hypothetical protein
LKEIYVCNTKKEPITSFRPEYLTKFHHIGKGIKKLDNKLLDEFEYTPKVLFPKWYKSRKQFKHRPKGDYPTSALRKPYQYTIAMLCRLYGEPYTTHFPLFYMSLIYYCADEELSFNWDDILSTNLTVDITAVVGAQPGSFPSFHMSSYLLDIMCVSH